MSLEAPGRDRRAERPAGVAAVECRGPTYRFGSHTAVERVDLEVPQMLSADASLTGCENVSLFARLGLDPIARAGVWERLRELRAASGTTILLTTHYLDEADHLCERVALLHRGRLRAVGALPVGCTRSSAESNIRSPAMSKSAPDELKSELGPQATLEDVFRHHTGERLEEGGDLRDVRGTRRTARRLA